MNIFYILFLVTSLTFYSGCGPAGAPGDSLGSLGPELQTGAVAPATARSNAQNIPYTVSGNREQFNQLRSSISRSPENSNLAKSIRRITIHLLKETNSPALSKPKSLQMKIMVSDKNEAEQLISFDGQFQSRSDGTLSASVIQNERRAKQNFYAARLHCLDEFCKKIDIHIQLHKGTANVDPKVAAPLLAEAVATYNQIEVAIRARTTVEPGQIVSPTIAQFIKSNNHAGPNAKATMTSFAVVDGPSASHVLREGFEVEIPRLDTADEATQLQNIKIEGGDLASVESRIVGNDPENGAVLLTVTDNATEETTTIEILPIELAMAMEKTEAEQRASRVTSINQPGTNPDAQLFPTELVSPTESFLGKSLTAEMNSGFAKYDSDPTILCLAEKVYNNQSKKVCGDYLEVKFNYATLAAFLTYSRPIVPYLTEVTHRAGVSPLIGYLLMNESHYAKKPDYPTKEVPARRDRKGRVLKDEQGNIRTISSAYGPWQVLDGTAKDLSRKLGNAFKIFSDAGKKQLDGDDRSYFMNSTLLAAVYLADLYDTHDFSYDPALMILSYFLGPGSKKKNNGAIGVVNSTKEHTNARVTFKEILRYRVQTKPRMEAIKYVLSFLVAREIGQNLDRYRFDLPQNIEENYKDRLYNPNSDSLGAIGLTPELVKAIDSQQTIP